MKPRTPAKSQIELKYGITEREYNQLLVKQKHGCAICGGVSKNRKLAVDHDHKTNRVRGLLCTSCNPGLGYFKDSVKLLEAAASYLR